METVRIRDLGWKKVGSRIRDKHPGSATLRPGADLDPNSLELLDPAGSISKTDPDPGIKSHFHSGPDPGIKSHFNLKKLSIEKYLNLTFPSFFFS